MIRFSTLNIITNGQGPQSWSLVTVQNALSTAEKSHPHLTFIRTMARESPRLDDFSCGWEGRGGERAARATAMERSHPPPPTKTVSNRSPRTELRNGRAFCLVVFGRPSETVGEGREGGRDFEWKRMSAATGLARGLLGALQLSSHLDHPGPLVGLRDDGGKLLRYS
jgi:hypothetical protein